MSSLEERVAESRARKARSVRDNAAARVGALPEPSQALTRHAQARRRKAERNLREAEAALARAQAHVLDLKVPRVALQRRGPRL